MYPAGVSKTLSGKYQARIKLNGKRYDLDPTLRHRRKLALPTGLPNVPAVLTETALNMRAFSAAQACPQSAPLHTPCICVLLYRS